MRSFIQILFLVLTWFTNLANATPVFTKVTLPSYQFSFSKTENAKEEGIVKIGVQNFARSGIENENQISSISNGEAWASIACFEEDVELVQGAGNWQAIKTSIANRIVGKQGWVLKYRATAPNDEYSAK